MPTSAQRATQQKLQEAGLSDLDSAVFAAAIVSGISAGVIVGLTRLAGRWVEVLWWHEMLAVAILSGFAAFVTFKAKTRRARRK